MLGVVAWSESLMRASLKTQVCVDAFIRMAAIKGDVGEARVSLLLLCTLDIKLVLDSLRSLEWKVAPRGLFRL